MRSAPWSNKDFWIYVDRSGTSRAVNMLLGASATAIKKTTITHSAKRRAQTLPLCPIRITPFLKGVANRLSATDALPENSRQILLYGLCRNPSIYWVIFYGFPVFRGVLGWVFPGTAPNQHRLSSAFSGEPPNTAPSPFSLACFHIHSKTACRGFKSFCPCQVYLPKMMQVRKKPGIPGFFRVLRTKKGPSRRDVFE